MWRRTCVTGNRTTQSWGPWRACLLTKSSGKIYIRLLVWSCGSGNPTYTKQRFSFDAPHNLQRYCQGGSFASTVQERNRVQEQSSCGVEQRSGNSQHARQQAAEFWFYSEYPKTSLIYNYLLFNYYFLFPSARLLTLTSRITYRALVLQSPKSLFWVSTVLARPNTGTSIWVYMVPKT